MTTINRRVFSPQAMTINGIAVGGILTVAISEGHDNAARSSPDGFQVQVVDKFDQFCRGTITVQDWPDAISLLTGTLSTCVFWERKSGTPDATGYIKHTLTNPVIHKIAISINKGGYATVSADFECRAASDTDTLAVMHAMLDSQAAPTALVPALGGWRVVSAVYGGTLNLYHVTGFNFSITLPLIKDSNDADLAYTAVDACLDGIQATGSINFQDSGIATTELTSQQLLLAALGNLVITVKQAQGATNKVITIMRTTFLTDSGNSGGNVYAGHSIPFEVTNNLTTPLTLAGTNKIIVISDAA
ncbi:MAG: hypothetical protein ABSB91_00245 [Sedimentisphaerales bacterium]